MQDQSTTDQTHEARIRFLCAVIAQRILMIPDDASRRSRAIRIGKVRQTVDRFVDHMAETTVWTSTVSVTINVRAVSQAWWQAKWQAWERVSAALKASNDLAAFLFPNDEIVTND